MFFLFPAASGLAEVRDLTAENSAAWFKKASLLEFKELTTFTRRGRPIPNPVYFAKLPEIYNLMANGPVLLNDLTRTYINSMERVRTKIGEIKNLSPEDRKFLTENSERILTELYALGPALEPIGSFDELDAFYRRRRMEINVFPARVGLAGGLLAAFDADDPARNLAEITDFLSEPVPTETSADDYYAIIESLIHRAAEITLQWSRTPRNN
jgi:hypothetical protein